MPHAETLTRLRTPVVDVLGDPRRRLDARVAVITAISRGDLRIHPGRDTSELRGKLRAIPASVAGPPTTW